MGSVGMQDWLNKVHLDKLAPTVLYTDPEQVAGHCYASVMRQGFSAIGVEAFFCVGKIPVVAFTTKKDLKDIAYLRKALWNQGVISMLVAVNDISMDIYSLYKVPNDQAADTGLVETLDLVMDALAARNFLAGVESGRSFVVHKKHFNKKGRVDQILLDNLSATEDNLIRLGMKKEPARALVIQTVFIAYLEDRGLITPEFISRTVGCKVTGDYLALLKTGKPSLIKILFKELHRRFNGNVFYSPSAFGENDVSEELTPEQIECLANFRSGSVHVSSGQQFLWPYDFRFVQVELISAIYDRLLSTAEERKKLGAFFTPHYLADFTIDQVLTSDHSNSLLNDNAQVCDASCGSGVFLVSFFKRAVENYRLTHGQPGWGQLINIAERLHGIDPQRTAVRLAVFSLYIAMVEEAGERLKKEIEDYIPLFPQLYGETIRAGDFFDLDESVKFSCILGNPPWASRGNSIESAENWAKNNSCPTPQKEAAWAFVWKSIRHLEPDGFVALLLPAMGLLHNHNSTSLDAQKKLSSEVLIKHIYDLSDISFQLFSGAKRPTALMIMQPNMGEGVGSDMHIEYLCPKVSRVFNANVITVEKSDVHSVSNARASRGQVVWKELLWGTSRERKLLGWLRDLPPLSSIMISYKKSKALSAEDLAGKWVIGQGFKPAILDNIENKPGYAWSVHKDINDIPFFHADGYTPFVLDTLGLTQRTDPKFHNPGFKDGYYGSRIIIPQGVERNEQFLRAAYTDNEFSFQDSLQAVKFPEGAEAKAKFLTAFLNSSLAAWFLFHTTANWGVDRAKVHLEQIPMLPFPDSDDCRDPKAAVKARRKLVELIDELQLEAPLLMAPNHIQATREKIDELIYQYFGLIESEITAIEDTVKYVMPSIQPRRGKTPVLRTLVRQDMIKAYANTLSGQLNNWLSDGKNLQTTVYTGSQDFLIAEFSLSRSKSECFIELACSEAIHKLETIRYQIIRQRGALFGYVGEVRVWIGEKLYFIKPNEIRHWMRSTALNDADMIASSVLNSLPGKEN